MLRLNILFFIFFISTYTFAQDSHIFSKESSMPELTNEIKQTIQEIPLYKSAKNIKTSKNVSFIDNSKLKFFPPIFNQLGNSCSQASGIRYIFSYELNRIKNTDASLKQNVYSYHYTWNFLNDGIDVGSWYFDGYKLVKDNGVPSLNEFNDESGINEKTWMTGYSKYFKSLHNKITDYKKIDASSETGLDQIKEYLIHHGDDSEVGGLINFSAKSSNWDMFPYYGTSNTDYHYAIKNFGDGGDHAMTIVGFDDSIKVDVNSDGIIQDDETGALIIVNSWGSGWGTDGRAYMPYKLLYKSYWSGGIGNGDKYVYIMNVEDHTPSVAAKINIKYSSRNDLWMIIGVAESANAEYPDKTKTMKIFKKMGGDFYMQGSNVESGKKIEIALDYSSLIDKIPNAKKFFLTIKQSPEGQLGEGIIEQFSIMDYRNSTTQKEYTSTEKNISINSSSLIYVATESATGQNKIFKSNKIELFPNPVSKGSNLHINLQDKIIISKIQLIDINGRLINLDYSENNEQIQVLIPTNISNGIYFIKVFGKKEVLKHKILIY